MEQNNSQAKLNAAVNQLNEAVATLTELMSLKATDAATDSQESEWPQLGNKYWALHGDGAIVNYLWMGRASDLGRRQLGNVYRAEKEVEQHKLRLESMAQRWQPEADGNKYFYIDEDGDTDWNGWGDDAVDRAYFFQGNCHPTEEAAKAWGSKYGDAWKALLKVQS